MNIVTVSAWVHYYAVTDTVAAAGIAATASIVATLATIVNTMMLIRHQSEVHERFDERRNVVVKGTPDDPHSLIIAGEERRGLEQLEAERREGERRRRGPSG